MRARLRKIYSAHLIASVQESWARSSWMRARSFPSSNSAQRASAHGLASVAAPKIDWAVRWRVSLTWNPIQDLNGLGKQFRSGIPDPDRTIAQHRVSGRLGEASPRGFPQHALGEVGSLEAGVRNGGAFNGG
jgi:hypothetical protein